MNNAPVCETEALSTDFWNGDGQSSFTLSPAASARENSFDDDVTSDWVTRAIAARFCLSINVARLVCAHAGLGTGAD